MAEFSKREKPWFSGIIGLAFFAVFVAKTIYHAFAAAADAKDAFGMMYSFGERVATDPISLCLIALLILLAYVYREELRPLWRHALRQPPEQVTAFTIRPIGGDSLFEPFKAILSGRQRPVMGKLAITNTSGSFQPRCYVQLVSAFWIHDGQIMTLQPSVNPADGESFLLRWANGENASQDGKYLDIHSDGRERIAECLVVNYERPGRADFCAANPDEIHYWGHIDGGPEDRDKWWKISVRVGSDSGASATLDLVASCGHDPGPITLEPWHPRGEKIIAAQLAAREKRKQAKASGA
jgi:hypothetical protein